MDFNSWLNLRSYLRMQIAQRLIIIFRSMLTCERNIGNDSNLLIVFYVQIMPDDFVMQLHRF
ncbi:pilus assembly protein [Klebsiella pneumoniae]|nr:pilus assembly protein [Klebsiella pneumoniae]